MLKKQKGCRNFDFVTKKWWFCQISITSFTQLLPLSLASTSISGLGMSNMKILIQSKVKSLVEFQFCLSQRSNKMFGGIFFQIGSQIKALLYHTYDC